MKRSEALKKLKSVLFLHEVITRDRYEMGYYDDRAEDILQFIEKDLGMKPPFSSSMGLTISSGMQWEPE